MRPKSSDRDPRVRATATIWTYAVALLGVCIPLVSITNSGLILPFLVIFSAGSGTIAIWISSNRRQPKESALAQEVKRLEERVMNLETIYTSLPEDTRRLLVQREERA